MQFMQDTRSKHMQEVHQAVQQLHLSTARELHGERREESALRQRNRDLKRALSHSRQQVRNLQQRLDNQTGGS